MATIWKFKEDSGRGRGLLAIFILHSLNKKPKSGYDLLKEINEKTSGAWTPSKGTIYPILKQLENEKLIKVLSVGKRSKNIFELTAKGKKTLYDIKRLRKESMERFFQFRNLFLDVFGGENKSTKRLIFEINALIQNMPSKRNKGVAKILEKCLSDLKKVQ